MVSDSKTKTARRGATTKVLWFLACGVIVLLTAVYFSVEANSRMSYSQADQQGPAFADLVAQINQLQLALNGNLSPSQGETLSKLDNDLAGLVVAPLGHDGGGTPRDDLVGPSGEPRDTVQLRRRNGTRIGDATPRPSARAVRDSSPLSTEAAARRRACLEAKRKRDRFEGGLPSFLEAMHNRPAVSVVGSYSTPESPHDHSRFDALGPVGPACRASSGGRMERYGQGDGEKRFCDLSAASAAGNCVVLSLGSNNQWEFEVDVYERTQCTVHTFDCTSSGSSMPPSIRSRVFFHQYCVGLSDEGNFRSWDTVLRDAGIATGAPFFVKMDIEGFEWEVLQQITSVVPQNQLPQQIALELHYQTTEPGLSWHAPVVRKSRPGDRGFFRTPGEIAAFGVMMHRAGYLLIDRHDNPHCPHCSELVWSHLGGGGGFCGG